MTARPVFGVTRMPASVAEDAPAWPPLKTLAVPLTGTTGEADPGLSQVELGDGVWHRFSHISNKGYVAACQASALIAVSRTRVTDAPTCPDFRCGA